MPAICWRQACRRPRTSAKYCHLRTRSLLFSALTISSVRDEAVTEALRE